MANGARLQATAVQRGVAAAENGALRGCQLRATAARGGESTGPDAAMALGSSVADDEFQLYAMATGVLQTRRVAY